MDQSDRHLLSDSSPLFPGEDEVATSDNLPFFLPGRPDGQAAVLLVHGFSASPWEMRPLAEFLAEDGYACLGVRLPGHGTTPEDLATRHWEEWLDAVTARYGQLAGCYQRVYAAGMSTGCLLLLSLALRQPLAGLVLLSPYLRIRHRLAPLAGWLRHFLPYQQVALDGPAASHYYPRRPLAGVHQINCLIKTLKPQLGEINVPVLAVHGDGDLTVDIASGRELLDRLSSRVVVHQRLGPQAPHVLTGADNPQRAAMFDLIDRFLGELEIQACRSRTR